MASAYRYDVKAGNAADVWSAAIPFDFTSKYLQIECWDSFLYIQFSYDNVPTWMDTIEIDPDSPPQTLPMAMSQMRIMNKTAGQVSRYQVVCMG